MTVEVPANILLAGEYAVTMEGGLGICVAIDPCAEGRFVRSETWELRGVGGGRTFDGSRGLLKSCIEELRADGIGDIALSGYMDTERFYDPSGEKRGLGSSAASVVGVCAAGLAMSGTVDRKGIFETALRAHRHFQGGGSGYDVAASCFGGVGLFSGGERPSWEPLQLDWISQGRLLGADRAVRTPGAVRRFYGRLSAAERNSYLDQSNEGIRALCMASTWADARAPLEFLRELGIQLGTRIDVPADLSHGLPPGFSKALGAGNELFLHWTPDSCPEGSISIHGGVEWKV